jgi:hypothetical protein
LNLKVSSEDEERDMQIQMLVVKDFITSKFGSLTIPEIKEAFKMYVAKEFPQIKVFRLLDCVSVGEILDAYIDFRNESLHVYMCKKIALLNAPTQPSDEEKKKIREQFLKLIFDDIVNTGFSSDAFRLFFELEESGKLKISEIDKKILYRQELEKYIPIEEERIKARGGYGVAKKLTEFKQLVESKKPISHVQNICRSISVSNYLKKYISDFETFKKAIE